MNNHHFKKYTRHYGITTIRSSFKPDEIVKGVKARIVILGKEYIRESYFEPKLDENEYWQSREKLDEFYSSLSDFIINVICLYELLKFDENEIDELRKIPKMTSLLKTETKIENIPKILEIMEKVYHQFCDENENNKTELQKEIHQYQIDINVSPSPNLSSTSPQIMPSNQLVHQQPAVKVMKKSEKSEKVEKVQKSEIQELKELVEMKDKEIEQLKQQVKEQMELIEQLRAQLNEKK